MTYGRCCLQSVDTSLASLKNQVRGSSAPNTILLLSFASIVKQPAYHRQLVKHSGVVVSDISDFAHCSLRRRELLIFPDLRS